MYYYVESSLALGKGSKTMEIIVEKNYNNTFFQLFSHWAFSFVNWLSIFLD
jgi:hypothetical protein